VKIKNCHHALCLFPLICALLLSACSTQPDNFVIILIPSSGAFLPVNQETQIISQVAARRGWSRLELYVNGELTRVDSAAVDTARSAIIKQPWVPTAQGPVLITVVAVNARDRRIASAEVAVLVGSPSPTALPPTPTPGTTPLPSPTPCEPQAALLQDVTIPPGTVLQAGQTFSKTWRVQNSGACPWNGYQLVFIRGSLLGGKSPTRVRELAPGEVTDISVELSAPGYQGDYAGVWRLQTEKGSLFGPEFSFSIRIPQPTPTRTQTPSPSATFTPTLTYTHTPDPTRTSTPTPPPYLTGTPTPTPPGSEP
jgi:hypothetical protein